LHIQNYIIINGGIESTKNSLELLRELNQWCSSLSSTRAVRNQCYINLGKHKSLITYSECTGDSRLDALFSRRKLSSKTYSIKSRVISIYTSALRTITRLVRCLKWLPWALLITSHLLHILKSCIQLETNINLIILLSEDPL